MKKLFILSTLLLTFVLLAGGCGNKETVGGNKVLKVGATAVPHAEILNVVKPILAKDGIDLQIVEMSDYVRPNIAVAEKELDANFFQHIPYLTKFASDRGLKLTYTAAVHIEPMGIYSKRIKDLHELASGAQVAIPNDPTNGGRALALLDKSGTIKLKDGVGVNATVSDIIANPKNIKITEIEAPQLPRTLDDVDLAVINTNYALDAKLVPAKDALFIEQNDSPYVNILTVQEGDENRPEIQKLTTALTSDEVRKFISEKYQGAVIPAF
jgi:D-methionine transport system substrate-binding protein